MAIDNNIQMYADKEKTQKIYPRTKADNVLMSDGKKVEDKISDISSDLETKASKDDVARISIGTPLFASNVAGMTDTTKNYVNTTDGYLYNYSEGNWIKSNVQYQSTGINDNDVKVSKLSNSTKKMLNMVDIKWVQGAIDSVGNIILGNTTRVVSELIAIDKTLTIATEESSKFDLSLTLFDINGGYIFNTGWLTTEEVTYTNEDGYFIRILTRNKISPVSNVTPNEIVNKIIAFKPLANSFEDTNNKIQELKNDLSFEEELIFKNIGFDANANEINSPTRATSNIVKVNKNININLLTSDLQMNVFYYDTNMIKIKDGWISSTNCNVCAEECSYVRIMVRYRNAQTVNIDTNFALSNVVCSYFFDVNEFKKLEEKLYGVSELTFRNVGLDAEGIEIPNQSTRALSNYIRVKSKTKINVDSTLQMLLVMFDNNGKKLRDTGWISDTVYYVNETQCYNFRVMIRYRSTPSANISIMQAKSSTNCYQLVDADILNKKPNTIGLSGNEKYKSINFAIESEQEGIQLLLKNGIYNETIRGFFKTINLIGENKKECIVKSIGNYDNPAIEASSGYFKSITFKSAGKENGFSENDNTPKAYALHVESDYSEGKELEFEDCIFYSDLNSAIGVGLRPNFTLKFKNCDFYSDCDVTYANTTGEHIKCGTIFFHDSMGIKGDNQKIIFDNCRIYNTNGEKCFVPYCVYLGTSNKLYVTMYNNILYSKINGKTNDVVFARRESQEGTLSGDNVFLTEDSFGNNVELLNA